MTVVDAWPVKLKHAAAADLLIFFSGWNFYTIFIYFPGFWFLPGWFFLVVHSYFLHFHPILGRTLEGLKATDYSEGLFVVLVCLTES